MGSRGPVPKRASERAGHRAKSDRPDTVARGERVDTPAPDDAWHPLAIEWYESLEASGQSQFYEPSDWAHARIIAALLNEQLTSRRSSSEMTKAIFAEMGKLGTTEGDRRRMRIEVERGAQADEGVEAAEAAVLEMVRDRGA